MIYKVNRGGLNNFMWDDDSIFRVRSIIDIDIAASTAPERVPNISSHERIKSDEDKWPVVDVRYRRTRIAS